MPISCSYNGNLPEGVMGVSPISVARESVGLSMAADEYGGRYFSNNASVGMALKFPTGVKLSDNAKKFLKESLAEYGKLENKFKSIILEDGGDLAKIGMSNEDSQFLESRQFQIEEIARIFRVPPIMIGHPTNAMTYASAEQLFLAFATYTIRPWCVRLEQSMNRYLIPERDRGKFFFEFNLAGLLRGDTKSRYEAYAIARNWGWMNVDEIRSLENQNPLPEGKGKVYLQPLNMNEAGKPPADQNKQTGGNGNA
jgi:HK97 family phage portal protein